jgi:plastocyanin
MKYAWFIVLVGAGLALVCLAGCANHAGNAQVSAPNQMTPVSLTSEGAAQGETPALGDAVTIKDFVFHPATLRVSTGAEVTWTNLDSVAHTVTGSGFDSGQLGQGQSWSHVFPTPGTYAYHCKPHPYMTGTIIVG